MVKLERFGLWWKREGDKYGINNPSVIVSGEDFTELEAEALYAKFSGLAEDCIRTIRQVYRIAETNKERFYVLLDGDGGIRLPQDKDCKRIRTLDSSLIPGFEIAKSHI